jgi:hypothetical protein
LAIDLIKSYLVGIGFTVDENSFNQTQSSMENADKTINKFNKNSQEGFSSTNDALKGLFNLFKTSSGTLGKLFPELHAPLNNFLKDIALIKKLYSDLTKEFEKSQAPPVTKPPDGNENTSSNSSSTNNTTSNNRTSNLPSIIHNTNELANSAGNLVEQIINSQSAAEDLAEEGGNAFKLFSLKALGPIAAIVAGVAATALAIKGLAKYLGDLANQDIEYEKLSRQLWTTKENAKEVDMALKTMGVTMQDLWLSPTLLKQFNELRKDSAALKLPKEYTDNLKVIQGIGLEFSRLKQLGQLAFQWIGNYILKYAAEPLNELRQLVHSFNEWLVKNIPNIGKIIGTIVGVLIRIIAIILKIIGVVIKLTSPIIHIIELIGQIGDEFEKLPEPIKTTLKIIGVMILAVASPILFVIGLIDDLMTYFRGGKSLTGTVIDKIADKLKGLGDKIKNFSDACKNILKNIGEYFKKIIDEAIEYLENKFPIIKKTIDFAKGTKDKWDEFWGNDEESKKKKQENMADLIKSGLQFKQQFSVIIDKNSHNNAAPSYVAPNNTTTNSTNTTNSHNQVSNTNNINVYGGSDAKVTANTVKDRLTGITTRNLRGAY